MSKKTIAILFSILFVAFISAPSIIVAVDENVDVSIFYSITEEENENFKFPLFNSDFNELENLYATNAQDYLGYYFKNYSKPHLNLISPPPDYNII
ncbi:hypothetical protein [Bizionia sp. M204]|uniref:hypothetical protein n=1 Tax=Bizionia sp. M204 TaxID=2675331 RepID=UPI00206449E9|nr:hypothetical protein [Bizionia sp. M204]UPS92702.1 hypothetical protein GMA17_13655 [Bizionia sp. M204]